jgi:hypothetical protein
MAVSPCVDEQSSITVMNLRILGVAFFFKEIRIRELP